MSTETETILQEAQRLVHGDRQADYGHPLDNFSDIARGWEVLIGAPVSAEVAVQCMIWLKLCREKHRPKRDNRTDGAGYFEVLDMCIEEYATRVHAIKSLREQLEGA